MSASPTSPFDAPASTVPVPSLLGSLFSLRGRTNRRQFAVVYLTTSVIIVSAYRGTELLALVGATPEQSELAFRIAAWPLLPVLWVWLAAKVKRWHDMGRSGWFALFGVLPLLNLVEFLALFLGHGQLQPNRFGAVPEDWTPGQPSSR